MQSIQLHVSQQHGKIVEILWVFSMAVLHTKITIPVLARLGSMELQGSHWQRAAQATHPGQRGRRAFGERQQPTRLTCTDSAALVALREVEV